MKTARIAVLVIAVALAGCASGGSHARMVHVSGSMILYSHLSPGRLPASVLGQACVAVQEGIKAKYSRQDIEVMLVADRGILKSKILSQDPLTQQQSEFIRGLITPALLEAIEEENKKNEK